MRVHLLSAASQDFADAASYYEQVRAGLGAEFTAEVERAIDRIIEFPQAWARMSTGVRRFKLSRFPYGILYQKRDDMLVVVAVMHLRRKPDAWTSRI